MNETSIACRQNSLDLYESEDCDSDFQVDTISTASCHDEENPHSNERKDVLDCSNEPNPALFKSVSVVNSNDVHFGNKTVYKGPVTIKQFVYPNGELIKSDYVKSLEESVDSKNKTNGIYNPSFVKDGEHFPKHLPNVNDSFDKSATLPQQSPKGFHGYVLLLKSHRYQALIFIGLVVVAVAIISTILLSKSSSTQIRDSINTYVTAEEDNNIPTDFVKDPNTTLTQVKVRLIKRLQWLAQPPTGELNNLTLPISMVIIQHTATESCVSQSQCVFQTRTIQTFHIESHGWNDIGYNFLIGGDGAVYEGRGWTKEGAHTLGYNNLSFGIAFIGTFTQSVPPNNMIVAFQKLVELGVALKYLTPDYKILAHRQLIGTESPGLAFFELIKTWPHWTPHISTKT